MRFGEGFVSSWGDTRDARPPVATRSKRSFPNATHMKRPSFVLGLKPDPEVANVRVGFRDERNRFRLVCVLQGKPLPTRALTKAYLEQVSIGGEHRDGAVVRGHLGFSDLTRIRQISFYRPWQS